MEERDGPAESKSVFYPDVKTYGTDGYQGMETIRADEVNTDATIKFRTLLLYGLVTVLVFSVKVALIIISQSQTVVMSAVDSAGDIMIAGLILFFYYKLEKAKKSSKSPQGFERMHSVAIVIIVTLLTAIYGGMIYSSMKNVIDFRSRPRDRMFDKFMGDTIEKYQNLDAEDEQVLGQLQRLLKQSHISLENDTILMYNVICYSLFFVVQVVLEWYLRRSFKKTGAPLIWIIWLNNLFDIFTSISVTASFVVMEFMQKREFVTLIDASVSLFIGVVALSFWIVMLVRSVRHLAGRAPSALFYEEVTHTADKSLGGRGHVDTLLIYSVGGDFIVELTIRIARNVPLPEAVLISEMVSRAVGGMHEVERAFVSIKASPLSIS